MMTIKLNVYLLTFLLSFVSISCKKKCKEENAININNHLKNDVINYLIQGYLDEYGEYPDNLKSLTKLFKNNEEHFGLTNESIMDYLRDPFGKDSLFKYRVLKKDNKAFYLLYSVGPDGIDDFYEDIQLFTKDEIDILKLKSVYFDVNKLPDNFCEVQGNIVLNNELDSNYFEIERTLVESN